ncbi:MAG: acyl dehydratase [Alphaproteobacteria bacterium]|nr:MAG: acyl dehydratase [Alphaproteobacteria bacterium]
MDIVGLGLHYEELPIGRQFKTIGRTVTDADIVNFINCTGMTEVLFIDQEYLKEHSDIKGRVAPGALAYTIAEGLLVQSTMQHTGLAFLNMELNILGPVFAGDTIHVECEVIEARMTSKGGRGLVRTRNKIINQKGEVVIEYTPLRMIKCLDGA